MSLLPIKGKRNATALETVDTADASPLKRAHTRPSYHPALIALHAFVSELKESAALPSLSAREMTPIPSTETQEKREKSEKSEKSQKESTELGADFDQILEHLEKKNLKSQKNTFLSKQIYAIAIKKNQIEVLEKFNRILSIRVLDEASDPASSPDDAIATENLPEILGKAHINTLRKIVALGFTFQQIEKPRKLEYIFKIIEEGTADDFQLFFRTLNLKYTDKIGTDSLLNTLVFRKLETAKEVFKSDTALPILVMRGEEHPFFLALKRGDLETAQFISTKARFNEAGKERQRFLNKLVSYVRDNNEAVLKFCFGTCKIPPILRSDEVIAGNFSEDYFEKGLFLKSGNHLVAHAIMEGYYDLLPLLQATQVDTRLFLLASLEITLKRSFPRSLEIFQKHLEEWVEKGHKINFVVSSQDKTWGHSLMTRSILALEKAYKGTDEALCDRLVDFILFLAKQGCTLNAPMGPKNGISRLMRLRKDPRSTHLIKTLITIVLERNSIEDLQNSVLALSKEKSPILKRIEPLTLRLFERIFKEFPTTSIPFLGRIFTQLPALLSLSEELFEGKALPIYALENIYDAIQKKTITTAHFPILTHLFYLKDMSSRTTCPTIETMIETYQTSFLEKALIAAYTPVEYQTEKESKEVRAQYLEQKEKSQDARDQFISSLESFCRQGTYECLSGEHFEATIIKVLRTIALPENHMEMLTGLNIQLSMKTIRSIKEMDLKARDELEAKKWFTINTLLNYSPPASYETALPSQPKFSEADLKEIEAIDPQVSLPEIFEKINFEKRRRGTLLTELGKEGSKKFIKENILDRLLNLTATLGTPPKEDKLNLKRFYSNVEQPLKKIIWLELKKMTPYSPEEREESSYLFIGELMDIFQSCGSSWEVGVSQLVLNSGKAPANFDQAFNYLLSNLRRSTLQDALRKSVDALYKAEIRAEGRSFVRGNEVHYYNRIVEHWHEEFGIPKIINSTEGTTFVSDKALKEIGVPLRHHFSIQYNPMRIFDAFMQFISGPQKDPRFDRDFCIRTLIKTLVVHREWKKKAYEDRATELTTRWIALTTEHAEFGRAWEIFKTEIESDESARGLPIMINGKDQALLQEFYQEWRKPPKAEEVEFLESKQKHLRSTLANNISDIVQATRESEYMVEVFPNYDMSIKPHMVIEYLVAKGHLIKAEKFTLPTP